MLPKSALPRDLGKTLDHARRVMGAFFTPEVEAELRRIVRRNHRTMRRYGFAGRNGLVGRAASLEYRLSTSFGHRVIAVLHGYPKRRPHIGWGQVKQIANEVCPRLPAKDPVLIEARAKPEGGYRPIAKHGIVGRGNQAMATDLGVIRIGHSSYEYARKGKGREKLMDALNNANRTGGVRALGTADVKDCYLAMRREAAESVLPISKAITRNTIYISDDTPIVMNTDIVSEYAVRAGLPQGALSSVFVAGLIIQPCLDAISPRLAASYIDDLTIGDADEAEVKAQLDALAAKLATQHPSSPLFEKCRAVFKIGRPRDVLGYWARPNPDAGGLRFTPSNKAIRRFYVRLSRRLLLEPVDEWVTIIEEKAYAFAASFGRWEGAEGGRETLQTYFYEQIVPLLWAAHEVLTAAQANGATNAKLEAQAGAFAAALVPKWVLAKADALGEFPTLPS